jgi:hypothetical protein
MRKLIETKFLIFLLIIYLIVVLVSWFTRNTWFGWEYLDPVSKFMITLVWFGLVASLPGLLAIIVMKSQRLERAKTYVILLYLCILLSLINLISGVGWCVIRYESTYFITIHPRFQLSFQPPLLPVIFAIDTQGHISIEGNTSIVTEVGTFSIDADIPSSLQPENQYLLLIIKHRLNNTLVDTIYKIETGRDEVFIVTRGITATDITRNQIILDASGGDIQRIQVNSS